MKRAHNPRGSAHVGFNRPQSGPWYQYSRRKYEWIKEHPNASSREIDKAARQIAKELNL